MKPKRLIFTRIFNIAEVHACNVGMYGALLPPLTSSLLEA